MAVSASLRSPIRLALPDPAATADLARRLARIAEAGDVIIFTEALIHGTVEWTAEHERRSLLYRYSPKTVHFAGGTYQVTQPAWVSELTEAQQAVLEPPYIYNRPLIAADGVTVEQPRRE